MARRSLFAVATLAFGIIGASAGPCRPSTTVTSVVETSSTAVVETSSTTLAETLSTTLVETSSTTVAESSSTTLVETSTSLAETSSTTLAETSTTSQAPGCIETQVVINPSFDDNDGAPWSGIGNIRSDNDPRTGSHNLQVPRFSFNGGGVESYSFSQTLNNLQPGNYRLTYYNRVAGWTPWPGSQGFGCSITPRIGGTTIGGGGPDSSGPFAWTPDSYVWANTGGVEQAELSFSVRCAGEFENLNIAIDDVTVTEFCEEPQN